MKKFLSMIIIFLVSFTVFAGVPGAESDAENNEPVTDAREKSESEADEKEYNEFGIEIGTIVHGEDISKLSEEELQYIPEGWRDGVVEDEHNDEPAARTMLRSTAQSYPNVNDYILSNKLSAAKVEYDHKSFFTKFNYRSGYGKAEGVVAHETANNNSTITGEIAYMSKNHKNAFVHAFVDHNRIIEIHPSELGAWGGGRYANERFVHVELVRVHNFNDFAKSINNYSDYIASILYKHNLGVNNADNDGKGTLWSHRAVSNFLGGTTHVDPYGYFAKWGYDWNDFVSLVTSKYNFLSTFKESSTSKLGHINSSKVKIYPNLKQQSSYITAGSVYTNAVYYIKKEATLNGQKYYLLSQKPSSARGVVGWAKAGDINAKTHLVVNKNDKNVYLKGTGSTYSTAWGGSKDLVQKDLSKSKNRLFKVHLTESVGGSKWYRGELNGKTQWIHSSYVSAPQETRTSKLGHIRSKSVKIYKTIGDDSSAITAGSTYTNAAYYIKKETRINGQLYYLLSNKPSSVNGVVGWAKAGDITAHPHLVVDKKSKTFYIKGTSSAYNTAWGGSKDIIYKNLKIYKDQQFKVHLTESVGTGIWHRGTLNGKTIWIRSSELYKK